MTNAECNLYIQRMTHSKIKTPKRKPYRLATLYFLHHITFELKNNLYWVSSKLIGIVKYCFISNQVNYSWYASVV